MVFLPYVFFYNEVDILAKRKMINLRDASVKEILAFSLLPFGLLTVLNVISNALNVYLADNLGLGMVGAGLVLTLSLIHI